MRPALLCLLLPLSASALGRAAVAHTHHTAPHAAPLYPARTAVRSAPITMRSDDPKSRGTGVVRRVWSGLRKALFVGAATVLVRTPIAPEALAAKPPPPTTTKTKEVSPNGLPTLATIAMGGGLVYWSVKTAQEEDEEEQQRVKEETAKLESMQKEYTDIDEGVTVDEDLFASLRSRLNSTETIAGADGEGEGGEGGAPSFPPPPPMPSGGSAVLDKPPEPPKDEPSPGASAEDIERLKRMFGSGEGS